MPNIEMVRSIAGALQVSISDLFSSRNQSLVFQHGDFRKCSSLSEGRQEFVKESIEEYCSRFFTMADILDQGVLATPPVMHEYTLEDDDELNALNIRDWLSISRTGPVPELVSTLENKGLLIQFLDITDSSFSGINGLVNHRPYIFLNRHMTPERQRSTLVHELAHLLIRWPDDISPAECEKRANSISGAFLIPREDALRELGSRRHSITGDMEMVAVEYGISLQLLVKRAQLLGIVSENTYRNFCINISKLGWRKNEPSRIKGEEPTLLKQMILRAVGEGVISIQRGAELLRVPFVEIERICYPIGVH